MRGYKYLGYKKGDLPVTERIAKEIFLYLCILFK